ncbi:TolC family protein [Methylotuvimicrobium buryatense]|uniref:TolC family protein n=1 Tax=Methylotuvimicrobium buryatense TaxID=95641 RepID=A0A4P9UQE1_METBY|nr:TolC family protein [Methylotuvimicrobium buryatense]QCW82481.1 TolC family protein [Methylotuvimicrobium buryatense]
MPVRKFIISVIALALVVVSGFVKSENVLTLEAALGAAVQNNPSLARIKAAAQALAAIPSQAGALPDPVIGFNVMSLPVDHFDTRKEEMAQIGFGISQAIPFPGKLTLREQAAAYEAQAAAYNEDELRLSLLSDVKTVWWQLFYLDRLLEITDNNRMLLQQLVDIAGTKYEVGEGLQQDVLLAQLELSKLLDRKIKIDGMRSNAVAGLNALLDLPGNIPVQLPTKVALQLPDIYDDQTLYRLAETYRPLLASERERVNAAKSKLDLAKREILPDFNVNAAYGARDNMPDGTRRSDLLSFGISMNVPIFYAQKQAQGVSQSTSELMRERYALQDQWNGVRKQISQAGNDYRRAKEQVSLYETGIIPQAQQTVASMLAGYQVNKVDFLNLIRSQITVYDFEAQYWQAFAEANQALAQLVAATGKEDIYE